LRFEVAGFRVEVRDLRFEGAGFSVQGPGSRVQGPGFRDQGAHQLRLTSRAQRSKTALPTVDQKMPDFLVGHVLVTVDRIWHMKQSSQIPAFAFS